MASPIETPQQRRDRIADAKSAHEAHSKAEQVVFPAVITLGTEALKSAALINGGSAAAVLAFIAAAKYPITYEIISALKAFCIGLFCAVVATGSSYFTQFCYQNAHGRQTYSLDWPFVRPNIVSKTWAVSAVVFHALTVVLVMGAYFFVFVGFFEAASSLHPLPDLSR